MGYSSLSFFPAAYVERHRRPAPFRVLYTACLIVLKAYHTSALNNFSASNPPFSSGFACLSSSSKDVSPSSPPRLTRRNFMTHGGSGSEHGTASSSMASSASSSSLDQPVDRMAVRRPLIITGPSGVGKGTLIRRLLGEYPLRFGFSCSHTTRGPRPGEKEGVDYFFTTRERLQAEIDEGKFLEHATVHNNLYGTSFEAIQKVQEEGKICILDIDVQGVISVKGALARGALHDLRPLYVFISPPSLAVLESRLRGRETEKEEDVLRRLKNAKREVEYGVAPGNFDKVVVNADLDDAYIDLRTYIETMYYGDEEVQSSS